MVYIEPVTALSELPSELPNKTLSDIPAGHKNASGESLDNSLDESPNELPKEEVAFAPYEQEEITIKELAEQLGIKRQAIQQREKSGTLKNLGWELIEGTGTSRNNPKRYRRIKF